MRLLVSGDLVARAYDLYCSGLTLNQCALAVGWKSGTTVLYHFQKNGLATRPRGGAIKKSQAGQSNGNWKGGRVASRYVRVWSPSHPNADPGGYVREHRLVAERALGRYMKTGEVVHHVNGNTLDNRPQNLVVCRQGYHAGVLHGRRSGRWSE